MTTDHYEVFGDATIVRLPDRFSDALSEPVTSNDQLIALLMPSAVTIPPSDLPATALPDCEPTAADLLAIESWDDERIDARIGAANTRSAFEAQRRELLRLRTELSVDVLAVEANIQRAA